MGFGHSTETRDTSSCYQRSPQATAHLSVWCQHFHQLKWGRLKGKKKTNQHTTHKSKCDNWYDYFRAWLALKPPGAWVTGETGEAAGWAPQQAGEIKWDLAQKHLEVTQEPNRVGYTQGNRRSSGCLPPFLPHTSVNKMVSNTCPNTRLLRKYTWQQNTT